MVAARDEGLIAGVGLSNISLEQLRHAAARTDIVCVQNMFHLADRRGAPILEECLSRGIAFVPFCPLGWPRGQDNPVLTSPMLARTAARLGVTPAQVALQWLLRLGPNVLLIPGTGSADSPAGEPGRRGRDARRRGAARAGRRQHLIRPAACAPRFGGVPSIRTSEGPVIRTPGSQQGAATKGRIFSISGTGPCSSCPWCPLR